MPGEDQATRNRDTAEFRAYVDELWRRLRVFTNTRHELSEHRLREYASSVGDPELYEQFRERLEP